MTVVPKLMTTDELEAMPDDGKERWLIEGQLREAGEEDGEVTRRNRGHGRIEMRIGQLLSNWLASQPQPRGEVVGGEAGFRLSTDPDTTAGVDVAYISAATAAANPDDDELVNGAPELAVEILSPYDKHKGVVEKVQMYLTHGVKLVWIVEPRLQTISVYRPDAPPQLYNTSQEITAEPHLPGFRVAVRDIFAR